MIPFRISMTPAILQPGTLPQDVAAKLAAAYAVNIPDSESSLDPIDPKRVEDMLEKGRISIVKDLDTMQRAVSKDRVGRELFAPIMLLLLIIITVEGWFASRFYKKAPSIDGVATEQTASAIQAMDQTHRDAVKV